MRRTFLLGSFLFVAGTLCIVVDSLLYSKVQYAFFPIQEWLGYQSKIFWGYLGGNALCFLGLYLIWQSEFKLWRFAKLLSIVVILQMLMLPGMSHDIYRYMWDGMLSAQGISPYLATPSQLAPSISPRGGLQIVAFMDHFKLHTVYPPISQVIFAISAILSFDNYTAQFLILKAIAALCFFWTIRFTLKSFALMDLEQKYICLFALNPFILTELLGQHHTEAYMLAAMSGALYYYLQNNDLKTILCLSIATYIKLYPVLFIPLILLRRNSLRHMWIFLAVSLITIPFYTRDMFAHIYSSLKLYANSFEYNSFVFLWLREIGGRLGIDNSGKIINKVCWLLFGSIYAIQLLVYRKTARKDFIRTTTIIVFCYLLLIPVVFPWYIIPFLYLCLFFPSQHKTMVIWSCTAIPTYFFVFFPFYCHLTWISVEYLAVIVAFYPFLLHLHDKLLSGHPVCH